MLYTNHRRIKVNLSRAEARRIKAYRAVNPPDQNEELPEAFFEADGFYFVLHVTDLFNDFDGRLCFDEEAGQCYLDAPRHRLSDVVSIISNYVKPGEL
jgi:hypothetical protein